MRVYLKTINTEGNVSYQDAGFVKLKRLLQNGSLLGLSAEINDSGSIITTHYLYRLSDDKKWIERYPVQKFFSTVIAKKDCTRSSAITDPFIKSDESSSTSAVPALPHNASRYFFSEAEKEVILSTARKNFLEALTLFKNTDTLTVKNILNTLFSAGFLTHTSCKNNLDLVLLLSRLRGKDRLKEFADGLCILHKGRILTQGTFNAVVSHEKPFECASGLQSLINKYPRYSESKIFQNILFCEADGVEDRLFQTLPDFARSLFNTFAECIIHHSFPEKISKIIVLLYNGCHVNKIKLDAIASIKDPSTLDKLRFILFFLFKNDALNENNCQILLEQLKTPLKFEQIFNTINHLNQRGITFNQSVFNLVISQSDPRNQIEMLLLVNSEEEKARQIIIDTAKKEEMILQKKIAYEIGFLSRLSAGILTAGRRQYFQEIDSLLQKVVYGEESAVKQMLEAAKRNPIELRVLLSDTGTAKDHSGHTVTGMTLFQAAATAGNIKMCHMLKNYMLPLEIISQLDEIPLTLRKYAELRKLHLDATCQEVGKAAHQITTDALKDVECAMM